MNIRKLIKWLKSFSRIFLLKMKYGNRFIVEYPVYLGKNVKIYIEKKSKIILTKGAYISDYCSILAMESGIVLLDENVYLADFSKIMCRKNIMIGQNVLFGPNVSVYDHDHVFDSSRGLFINEYSKKDVVIEENSWLATNVVVTKGAVIKKGSIIGANSVVTGTNEKSGLYVGIPAVYKKSYEHN